MDESWMMRIGMPPRRRSATSFTNLNDVAASVPFSRETAPYHETSHPTMTRRSKEEHSSASSFLAGRRQLVEPDDFSDVFGGPPHSVLLSREYDRSSSTAPGQCPSFYGEVFRVPEMARKAAGWGGGRSLRAFRIPVARGERFYDDVFGVEEVAAGRRSRERSRPGSKAKSTSSSVLSSEEISPPRRQVSDEDAVLYSFASKLRPINVPCRWNSNTVMPEEHTKKKEMPSFPGCQSQFSSYYSETDRAENLRSSHFKVSRQVSSPETISLEPTSYPSFMASADDFELLSPASPVSSLCQEPDGKEEDEVMSSYVIEINSNHREGAAEDVSIDEAIMWAKEKFRAYSSDIQSPEDRSSDVEETPTAQEYAALQMDGYGTMQMDTELLDEDVRSWSAGKETNIRLLLSTLHHILLPSSGWYAVPLTRPIESWQVKRAYQRARWCLHPDKMQQRGATSQQKYVAEKAFPILQDAFLPQSSPPFEPPEPSSRESLKKTKRLQDVT